MHWRRGRHGGRILILAGIALQAGPGSAPGTVMGVVRDATDGTPLPNALVTLIRDDRSTITNRDGVYLFRDVAPGERRVRATRIDFHPLEVSVDLPDGSTLEVDLLLTLRPVEMPAVEARASPPFHPDTLVSEPEPVTVGTAEVRVLDATPGVAEVGLAAAANVMLGPDPPPRTTCCSCEAPGRHSISSCSMEHRYRPRSIPRRLDSAKRRAERDTCRPAPGRSLAALGNGGLSMRRCWRAGPGSVRRHARRFTWTCCQPVALPKEDRRAGPLAGIAPNSARRGSGAVHRRGVSAGILGRTCPSRRERIRTGHGSVQRLLESGNCVSLSGLIRMSSRRAGGTGQRPCASRATCRSAGPNWGSVW